MQQNLSPQISSEVKPLANQFSLNQAQEDQYIQNELQAKEKYQKEKFWCADSCLQSQEGDQFYFLKGILCLKSKYFNNVLSNFQDHNSQPVENGKEELIKVLNSDNYLVLEVSENSETLLLMLELLYRAPTNQSLLSKESAYKITKLAAKYQLDEVLQDCYKYVSEHISRWELLQSVSDGQTDMIDWFLISKELKWSRVYDQCFRRIVRNLSRLQAKENFDRITKEERLQLFQQAYRLEHEKTEDQKKPVKPLKFPEEMGQGTSQALGANQQILNLQGSKSQTNSARTPRTATKMTPRSNMGRTPRGGPGPLSGTPDPQSRITPRQNSARAQQTPEANGVENGDEGIQHPFQRKNSLNGGASFDYDGLPSPSIERSTSLEGGCSISVKSLPQEITEEFLLDTFAHFGQIVGHKLNYTTTGAHAFIDYADAASGFKACRQNIFIENQQLQVRIKRMGAKKLVQPQQQ